MIAFPDSRRTRKLPALTLLVGPDASGVRLAFITGPTGRGQKRNPNRMGLKMFESGLIPDRVYLMPNTQLRSKRHGYRI